MTPITPLDQIRTLLGSSGFLDQPQDKEPYEKPWRGKDFHGKAALVALPTSVEQVQKIVKICHHHRIPIVPQGGNTGLVGGSTPDESGSEIVLNLSRMKRLRTVDPIGMSVTVEAGCVLASLNDQLAEQNLWFPVSIGSEGSAEIGGLVSTNAGGVNVIKYGTTRQLVMGLEVVLPDGSLLELLSPLKKDNTGYDLKQLFIGAEGTLGVITAATLSLVAKPTAYQTAFLALSSLEHAPIILQKAMHRLREYLVACELVPRLAVELVCKHLGATQPLQNPTDYMLLLELSGTCEESLLSNLLQGFLEPLFEENLITDGVLAESGKQRAQLWHIRDHISEAEKKEGAMVNFDITVPIDHVPAFITEASTAVSTLVPGIRILPFGHVGDGNIHFNLLEPTPLAPTAFLTHKPALKKAVYDIVHRHQGSISAEHGIGRERKGELATYKSTPALELMRTIKQAIDYYGVFNPGRVF
jgi:FAD/FMN-containing dehydrogenase